MSIDSGLPQPKKITKALNALSLGDIAAADILTKDFLENNIRSEAGLKARLEVLSKMKDFAGAVEIVARLIEIKGESKELFFQGAYYSELGGNYELALKGYEKVLELDPFDVLSLLGLGRCLLYSSNINGADVFFARAYELDSDNQDAAEYLALAYEKESNFTKGIPFCEEALVKFPESWMLQVVRGNLWGSCGKSAKGIIYVSKAIEMNPDHQKPLISAATLLNNMHRPFEALGFLEKARKIAPGDLNILLAQSALYRDIGRSKEALESLEMVLKYVPDLAKARSNYLLYMHDVNGLSREAMFSESIRFDQEICKAITPLSADFENDLSLDRPLVIGILSNDFREHSVAYFLMPLLEKLDKDRFKVYLFSGNLTDDEYTEKFKELAYEFIVIRDKLDCDVAEQMRQKKIDILIELSGHTSNSRINICAYKAAPIQIDWLGYPDTTGFSSIDYRIVDSITDPEGDADKFAIEKLVRMKGGFLCYEPPCDAPAVALPPVLSNNFITFGTFSNMAKINLDMIALWSRLLLDNPDSKLLLKNKALGEELGREEVAKRFLAHGVDSERIILMGSTPQTKDHLELYSKIDIALDTFPYNGTTTIFEGLYMGVPLIGLCGKTHCSRVGASILSRIGLEQLIASSPQQYLQIGSALARQIDDLRMLRAGMRERLYSSGLLDKERFTGEFSELLCELWKTWVESRGQHY